MSIESSADDHGDRVRSAREQAEALSDLLGRAVRARIYDHRGKIEPARKRRHRVASSLQVDLTAVETVTALIRVLRLQPDSVVMDWMQRPDLWIEFIDAQGFPLVTVGLLRPDRLLWEPGGYVRLSDPALVDALLVSLGVSEDTR